MWASFLTQSKSVARQNKTRKAPGALDPAVILPPHTVQNMLRSLNIRAQEVKWKFANGFVWSSDHEQKKKKRVLLDPVLTAG